MKKVNKIAESNLLPDIMNTPKLSKNINNHYSLIIHGYINTGRS